MTTLILGTIVVVGVLYVYGWNKAYDHGVADTEVRWHGSITQLTAEFKVTYYKPTKERTMTNNEVTTGQVALKSYVEKIDGWEANFVPDTAYTTGATEVIKTYDGLKIVGTPNPDAMDDIYAQCGLSLYTSITQAGYGNDVTQTQCVAAAQAVLDAVLPLRKPA